jgi:hypothetical protein
VAGRLANSENLVVNGWTSFNGRWSKSQCAKALMCLMQIVNHEVEWGISRNDPVVQHQYQVSAPAHFIDRHLRSIEYGAHAYCAHEPSRVLHAVGLQHDVCDAYGRALIAISHFPGA